MSLTRKISMWPALVQQFRIELRFGMNRWTLAAILLVALVSIPIVVVLAHLFGGSGETWRHLATTVLPSYFWNSLILVFGVGTIAMATGVATAWLVATCRFPGRRFFSWALILPLAVPAYISAYTYAGLFDYHGPVHSLLLRLGFIESPGMIDIMSLESLIFIMAFALYPYVYLTAKATFMRQSSAALEASRNLGKGPAQTFFKIALPLARPGIAAGVFLVLMEVLNDYGAAKYFGIQTFTTGIFRAWFSLGDPDAAIRLSSMLLLVVFVMMWLENIQRGRAKYGLKKHTAKSISHFRLSKPKAFAAFLVCCLPLIFGFAIPVLQLASWSSKTAAQTVSPAFLMLIVNSFVLALAASALCVIIGLIIAYAIKISRSFFLGTISRIAVLGYSIPGAVIAIGILIPFNQVDQGLDRFMTANFGVSTGLLLTGSIAALLFAYLVRFLAISFNPIKAGFDGLCGNLDEASRSMGVSPLKTLKKIDLPILRGTLLSAAILVFVDVLKELPLTLILRPFNFDTLAIKAFELASDEMVAHSANPAIIIVLTGIVPIIILNKLMSKGNKWTS